MAEKFNSTNICAAFYVDENKNLPQSEKIDDEFELTNELKVVSTSQSCRNIKDILTQTPSDCVVNNNSVGDGLSNAFFEEEKGNSQTDAELPALNENPCLDFQGPINVHLNALSENSDNLLDISLNTRHDSFGLNLSEITNENVRDEEFHDAVQFFKDPSAFSFLENKGGFSVTNDFTRSSICKNFDPLHAKFSSQDSSKINILQCINEASGERESFCDESGKKFVTEPFCDESGKNILAEPFCDKSQEEFVTEPLAFCDELQHKSILDPSNNVLISFNSPLICNVLDIQENQNISFELPQACPKDLNQIANVQELEVPKVLEKDELFFQSETVERSEVNAEKKDSFLCVKEEEIISEVSCENTSPLGVEVIDQHQEDKQVIFRKSVGNILLSFDSPLKCTSLPKEDTNLQKTYTEEEVQQALKLQELQSQEILLKKQQEMEGEIANIKQEMEGKILKVTKVCRTLHGIIEEFSSVILDISVKQKDSLKYIETLEQENSLLKGDVKTLTEDLQSVENTFSDFHKRYEQCKGMLKVYKDNEDNFKLLNEKVQNELKEQKEMYAVLQLRTQEITERANLEVANEKKSNDAQLTVLKAQLQKAELKISSLESDNKQLRIENTKLGGICDDLMARVSGT